MEPGGVSPGYKRDHIHQKALEGRLNALIRRRLCNLTALSD